MIARHVIKALANEIANDLFRDLKSGKLPKIGIDEIRAAIAVASLGYNDPDDLEQLEEMTTRAVVMKC